MKTNIIQLKQNHMKKKLLFSAFALYSGVALSTTVTIINSGFTFSPDTVTINVGDSVEFVIASNHKVEEVSQASWNANGSTALPGFSTGFSGGLVLPADLTIGTHYYVCVPHASMGMKGVIIVQTPTGLAENQEQTGISIYPNPSNGRFNLSPGQPEPVSGSQMLKQVQHDISIYNIRGEKVYTSTLSPFSNGGAVGESIDISNQAKGIYFVKFYNGQTVLTKKIILE